jgi:phosphonate transport system substrate-binding protein
MAALGPVADELQSELGRPVEILPLASYSAMIDAQVQRRIDGGFFSASAFVAADAACACLEPLVTPAAADGTLSYHAVIVARAGGGIAAPADLAGKRVAIGAADSLGTRRMQLAGLLSEGLDPTSFGSVLEVDSAEAAVRLVAGGGVDAAFAWSSLVGDLEAGYSRGTLADVVRSGTVSMVSLALIWSSPAIGHSPFAVLRTLPEADKAGLTNYLTGLSGVNPLAYDVLDPFYGGGYAAVGPHDYASLETLLAQDVDAIRLPAGPTMTGATSASEPLPATEATTPN